MVPAQVNILDILLIQTKNQPDPKHPAMQLGGGTTGGKNNTQTCQNHEIRVR